VAALLHHHHHARAAVACLALEAVANLVMTDAATFPCC
jgi:hypothetical protein